MSDFEYTFHNLIGQIYDAALEEQKWPSFLEAFAQAVDGCSAMLRLTDMQIHKAGFVASFGYDSTWMSAYCDHFVKLHYLPPAMNQFRSGEAKTIDQAISISEQRKIEYFNDYSMLQDKRHGLAVNLIRCENYLLMFAVQREKRAGAFDEEQVRLMNTLAPHVTRAVQVHRKLSSANVEREWAIGTLNQLRMGVILTSCSGKPLFINRAAELMMTQGSGISLFDGRLTLDSASETALLHRLIAGAAHGIDRKAAGSDMRISLPNRAGFVHCLVTPVSPGLSKHLDTSIESGCVAIFLSRPGSLQLPPKRLANLYGLSQAESKLAAKLATFNSLEQAANELGIAMGTARTQLSAVFAKTGANTQAELLMLLATGTLAHCNNP